MKNILFIIVLLMSFGASSSYAQTAKKKASAKKSISKKPQKNIKESIAFMVDNSTPNYDNNIEGVPYVAIIPFAEYSPQVASF